MHAGGTPPGFYYLSQVVNVDFSAPENPRVAASTPVLATIFFRHSCRAVMLLKLILPKRCGFLRAQCQSGFQAYLPLPRKQSASPPNK